MLNNLIWRLACQIIDDVLTLTILRVDNLRFANPPSIYAERSHSISMQGLKPY